MTPQPALSPSLSLPYCPPLPCKGCWGNWELPHCSLNNFIWGASVKTWESCLLECLPPLRYCTGRKCKTPLPGGAATSVLQDTLLQREILFLFRLGAEGRGWGVGLHGKESTWSLSGEILGMHV